MRPTTLVLFLLATGCSAPANGAHVANEASDPAAPEGEPSGSSGPETGGETEPGEEHGVRVLRFAEGAHPRIQNLPATTTVVPESVHDGVDLEDDYDAATRGPSSYPVVEFPEHTEELNRQLREEALEIMAGIGGEDGVSLGRCLCRATIARIDLVAVTCTAIVSMDRGAPSPEVASRSYRIEGSRLQRFDLREALLPGTELDDLVRQRCRRMLASHEHLDTEGYCAEAAQWATLSFEPRGLRVGFMRPGNSYAFEFLRAQIRFEELDGRVLADGPLGPALAEGAETVSVARPDVPDTRGEGHAVSTTNPLGQLMHRWAALPESDRSVVRIMPDEGVRGHLVVDADVTAERANAIASALGEASAEPTRWTRAPLTLGWAVTRRETNLRDHPSTAAYWRNRLRMPTGTFVLSLRGRLGPLESSLGRRDTWAFVSPAPGVEGWAAGNLLREHEGCRPSFDTQIAALPEARRARAARTTVTSLGTLRRRTGTTRVATFAASLLQLRHHRGARGQVRVEVHEIDEESCGLGRRLLRIDTEGMFHALRHTTTAARGGEPILVLATRVRDQRRLIATRWSVYEIRRSRRPVWSELLNDDTEIAPRLERGAHAILRYRNGDRMSVLEHGESGYAVRDVGPAPEDE